MLKALIIDDEFIVVEGLKKMIDWSRYGITVVGTANDGLTALELFNTHRPEIIFTDIRMPGMDGLQLIKEILKEEPNTICIVFSGFNEFEYVRKALRMGVTDYLEKPITIPMIEEALEKVADLVNQQSEMINIKTQWQETQQVLLEKATLDLMLENVKSRDEWRKTFGDEWDKTKKVQVIACSGSNYEMIDSSSSYRIITVSDGKASLWAIFYFETDTELAEKEIFSIIEKSGFTAGTGNIYTEILDISKSYREARLALQHGIFLEKKGIITIEKVNRNSQIPRDVLLQEDIVLYHLRNGDEEGLFQALEKTIKWLERENTNPEIAEQEIMRVVYLIKQVVEELGETGFASSQNHYNPRRELAGLNTRSEMAVWFKLQLKKMASLIKDKKFSQKHQAVIKACAYMKQHYSMDLTLPEVADYVGMNPNYFSMLFKEEMGYTYISYLTEYRMEMAKQKLIEGEKVKKVSEQVGYNTYRHFVGIFKKYTGMTPGKYKKQKER